MSDDSQKQNSVNVIKIISVCMIVYISPGYTYINILYVCMHVCCMHICMYECTDEVQN